MTAERSRSTPAPPDIYEYRDYKAYLRDLIGQLPNSGRGERKSLAEAMRCQVAYVSHVLAGDYHFSVEQGEAASRHFGLPAEEAEFLVLLVSHNRAGTSELRGFFAKQLDERTRRHQLKRSRVRIKDSLGREDQGTYYSQWYYGAVHVLLTIPELRTRDAIARRLRLTPRKVAEILSFLVDRGLAHKDGAIYRPTSTLLHLDEGSPLIAIHHTNWRMQAVAALADEKPTDLHYSAVVSCAEKDLPRVRQRIARCLEDCMEIIKPSAEERLVGLCLDWFEV